ncbi:MAG: isoprenylcysteine carboxylmethyltransferase family protein [Planctomycetes bacterium]|nr:isoprenylcysteine carboxylmethyltransferase family protein [Planctomycetota bacterium]
MWELGALALGWAVFATVHSLLAEYRVRVWMGGRLPAARVYRLAYNALTLAMIAALVAAAGRMETPALYEATPPLAWGLRGVQAAGLVLSLASAWGLGMLQFLGVAQLCVQEAAEPPALQTRGLYALCRHPMGFGLLLMLWPAPRVSVAYLVTVVCITLYLAVGTWLEERQLAAVFGEEYRQYCRTVPCLLPWPRPVADSAGDTPA